MLGKVIQLFKGKLQRRFHGECQRCGRTDYLPWATEHGVRYCGHCWENDAITYNAAATKSGVEVQIGPVMIEEVMADWEREHPGRDAKEMTSKEFADRMMVKTLATAKPSDAATH